MGLDATVCNFAHYAEKYGDEHGDYTRLTRDIIAYLFSLGVTPTWDLNDASCPFRGRIGSYGTLHILRNYVYSLRAELSADDLRARGIDPDDPRVVEDLQFSNLCEHSDCDGVYLPEDFDKPLEEMLWGSVPALAREMELARKLLRIPCDAVKDDHETTYRYANGSEWSGWGDPPADAVATRGRYQSEDTKLDNACWVWHHFNEFVQAAHTHRLPLHFH